MSNNEQNSSQLRVAGLDTQKPTAFELTPLVPERKAIANRLNLVELRKLRFSGQITASGDADWRLDAQLGATVVQSCVLTLAPVSTRIDVPIIRDFIDGQETQTEADEEIEVLAGDNSEPLGNDINLMAVMIEALSLALPLYPKAEGASLKTSTFSQTGTEPMSDADARPFAGLAALRNKLEKGD